VVLKNVDGIQFEIVADASMKSMHGAWSSIGAGDFDGDGDQDLILGNLGENHRFNVDEQHPMHLYAVDLDQNGTIDPLTTAYWANVHGKMEEYPINYLDELAAQSPYFRKTFTSYTAFSYADVSKIFDPKIIPAENVFSITTTSSYVLWNEDGNYVWQRLQMEAQTAPIRKMLVSDFNNDGFEDIILGGNDYTYDVSTGYYSANKGTVLLGDSGQNFIMLPPAKSGFTVDGQVESLMLFEGNPSLVVTGLNRKPVKVFQLKD